MSTVQRHFVSKKPTYYKFNKCESKPQNFTDTLWHIKKREIKALDKRLGKVKMKMLTISYSGLKI